MQWTPAALAAALGAAVLSPPTPAQTAPGAGRDDQQGRYLNFEVGPVRSVAYDAVRERLVVLNQPGNRLAVLDPLTLERRLEIPIALGAASLALRPGTEEAWVVDRVYGSVQVVDLARGILARTIRVEAEPHGIAFAPDGARAWVTCSGADSVVAIDAAQYAVTQSISIPADAPRGIAHQAGRLWVASFLSGNATAARGTLDDPLAAQDVATTARAGLTPLPDLDLFPIRPGATPGADALQLAQAREGLGTILFDVVARPATRELWIPGTEALNATHRGERSFLGGQVVSNRIAIVDTSSNAPPRIVDLDALAPPGTGCAQPTSLVFDPVRPRVYVCAYGSDLVAVLDLAPDGAVSWAGHVTIPAKQVYPRGSGPRSAAIDPAGDTLWVFNRNDASVARIDLAALPQTVPFAVTGATPRAVGFDPTIDEIQLGRHLFTDARNSASKTSSCASCHVDGNTDALAWELSHYLEPEGTPLALTVSPLDAKGPLVTQGTRRQEESSPYHWRGEKRALADFNASFVSLLDRTDASGVKRDIGPDFQYLRHYIDRMAIPANPLQRRDRTLSAEEQAGLELFLHRPVLGALTCAACHALPLGSSGEVAAVGAPGVPGAFDVPGLRRVADREQPMQHVGGGFGKRPTRNAGLTHAGIHGRLEDTFAPAPSGPADTHRFGIPAHEARQIAAFLRAFDTGLAPATAWMATAHAANWTQVESDDLPFLLEQAAKGHCDVVALRSPPAESGAQLFVASAMYAPERGSFRLAGGPVGEIAPRALLAEAAAGRPVTFLGVPLGMGLTTGLDRDNDRLLNADELLRGTDPEEPDTDGDGLVDGYEVLWGSDPLAPGSSVPDTTPPALAGPVRVLWATTNTIKIEFRTTEFARVYVGLDGGSPVQRVPIGSRGDDTHWVILNGLQPDREYQLDLWMRDPSQNAALDSTTRIRSAPRALVVPSRVAAIRPSVVAGPRLRAEVDVRLGPAAAGAGYRVRANLHHLSLGALPTAVALELEAWTDAAGTAIVEFDLGGLALPPGLLFVVVEDVVPPAGGAPYAVAHSAALFASVPY
ncbi:MAG: hypothetical protein JNK02_09820 [Planctomycetes bacterium]|nr:hypothetical protein [Planctomycetota bacterium]